MCTDNRQYFFCYSMKLYKFLKLGKGMKYICTGLHEKTKEQFWLFERNEYLHHYLVEYRQRGIQKGVIV